MQSYIAYCLVTIANGSPVGDSVNGSDVPPRDGFPFFAPPHQPLASGATDTTKN